MAMTLAQLKRDAQTKSIQLKIKPVGIWSKGIPERLNGWRKVIGANTVGIFLLNSNGQRSELRIKNANLVEYDNNTLTVYGEGQRDLTDGEKKIMNEWDAKANTKEHRERAWNDAMTDGSSTYWEKKWFFQKNNAEHLLGYEFCKGMKYDWNTGKVWDNKIKGEIELQYEVERSAQ